VAVIKADFEFFTGLIAQKTEIFSGLVGISAGVKKTTVFLPAQLQGM
jgi:hypothetical protein